MFVKNKFIIFIKNRYPRVSLERMELARIAFFLSFFYFANLGDYSKYSLPPIELWTSQSFFKLFSLTIPSTEVLRNLQTIWRVSILMAAIGFFTKTSCVISFALSLFILGISSGFTPSDFHHQLPVLVSGVFCFANVGRLYSLDFYLKKMTGVQNKIQFKDSHFDNAWPIFLIEFLLCTMYFKAGLSKLRISGFSWVSDNYLLANLKYAKPSFYYSLPALMDPLYSFLSTNNIFIHLSPLGVILLELSSLLPLFFSTLFPIYVFLWIIFHVFIYLLLGIWASVWLIPVYLAIVPWDLLVYRSRKTRGLDKIL